MTTLAPTVRSFHVYVIELDPRVLARKGFREENPDRDPSKPCLYVGQSARDPETRFRQHQEAFRANRFVRDFGVRVLHTLCLALPEGATREDARSEEARLGEELRRRGYAVYWR